MLPLERVPSSHAKEGNLDPSLEQSSNIKKRCVRIITRLGFFSDCFFFNKSWLGRAHYLVEGVIHIVYDSDTTKCSEWTKVKHVPHHRIVATFDGTWRGRIRWKRVGTGSYPNNIGRCTTSSPSLSYTPSISSALSSAPRPSISYSTSILSTKTSDTSDEDEDEWKTLLDLSTLHVIPKVVRPLEKQEPRESRKLWENVTNNLHKKEYSEATKEKIVIEQRQRDEAAERKRKGLLYVFFFFFSFLPFHIFGFDFLLKPFCLLFLVIGLFQDILFDTTMMVTQH